MVRNKQTKKRILSFFVFFSWKRLDKRGRVVYNVNNEN